MPIWAVGYVSASRPTIDILRCPEPGCLAARPGVGGSSGSQGLLLRPGARSQVSPSSLRGLGWRELWPRGWNE